MVPSVENGDHYAPPSARSATPNTDSDSTRPNIRNRSPEGQGQPAGFRRQRASRACETCHSRKVRCDAASLGMPCTNCVAFGIECRIPSPKRKKTGPSSERGGSNPPGHSPRAASRTPKLSVGDMLCFDNKHSVVNSTERLSAPAPPERMDDRPRSSSFTNTQYSRPKFTRAPIKEAGRVAYLGESSNLSLLVTDHKDACDGVHYPLPDPYVSSARTAELDEVEVKILSERGAFLLPPREVCDELVHDYFAWIAPIVPVINKNTFMRRYRDPQNPPSLLLLQAVLLAGTRVCNHPQLIDADGSTSTAATTFYKRAKALFEANYEDDRVTIVQALVLMGWHWDSPEDLTRNVFYWIRVAITVALGSGMHRSVEKSQLSRSDKRLWKRIWWTLFTRDRSVAVALGRPTGIEMDDSDVEMLTYEDFIEDEEGVTSEFRPDPIHVQFFLNYVKLCEIMGLVLSQNYAVGHKKQNRVKAIDLTHSDIALADWLQNCTLQWDKSKHHFLTALLHANYYTTLCLLHRAHMPPAGAADAEGPSYNQPEETSYPSTNIACQAAVMITSIVETLMRHDQLQLTPAYIVYTLFSALVTHIYMMRSPDAKVVHATQKRINTCMNALRDVSKVWHVGKMVHKLFESILGNKRLEEKLQDAAGKRHGRAREKEIASKRKHAEMDNSSVRNSPAPRFAFERPGSGQPPAGLGLGTGNAAPKPGPYPLSSPPLGSGNELGNVNAATHTRQASPFNGFTNPGTPPDLFLHTRTSPNISQNLWQHYQPDQLFPPEVTGYQAPGSGSGVDGTTMHNGHMGPMLAKLPQMRSQPDSTYTQNATGVRRDQDMLLRFGAESAALARGAPQGAQAQSASTESWSGTSDGPLVPTTLNVGDWLEFFGLPSTSEAGMLAGMM